MKKKQLDPFTALVRTVGPIASVDNTRVNISRIRVRDGLAHATDGHRLVVTETSVPAGDYIRAGKGAFVPGAASDVFPDFNNVRPKTTVEAYQIPIAALRTDADGIILGPDETGAVRGTLTWNRPGTRAEVDTDRPALKASFNVDVAAGLYGRPRPVVGLNLRYMREVTAALGYDVAEDAGSLIVRLDVAALDAISAHRRALADAETRGGPDAERMRREKEPRYEAPVEILRRDGDSTCYGLVMPVRL